MLQQKLSILFILFGGLIFFKEQHSKLFLLKLKILLLDSSIFNDTQSVISKEKGTFNDSCPFYLL